MDELEWFEGRVGEFLWLTHAGGQRLRMTGRGQCWLRADPICPAKSEWLASLVSIRSIIT